jgi:DNA-binding HxlR family transcriptional regulator
MIQDIERIFTTRNLDFTDLSILNAIASGDMTLGDICIKVNRENKRQWLHHRLAALEKKGLLKQSKMKRGDTRRVKRGVTVAGKKMLDSLKNL